MDWSWSAVADDVSALTDQLTVWEMRLFGAGATSMQQWDAWQQLGKRRSIRRRVVTPAPQEVSEEVQDKGGESPSKRPRLE